ncbi:hypothetical protein AaE_003075 [Aphanomyces astaci]|uniref:Uncharacterized protein n=1 Tax=Aphanomyces astaci TaxID=112090 RepID=A0A6A5ALY6_APHAT|nr:hypothetical protein AaE_003075 [Aphanomyces astaci]
MMRQQVTGQSRLCVLLKWYDRARGEATQAYPLIGRNWIHALQGRPQRRLRVVAGDGNVKVNIRVQIEKDLRLQEDVVTRARGTPTMTISYAAHLRMITFAHSGPTWRNGLIRGSSILEAYCSLVEVGDRK